MKKTNVTQHSKVNTTIKKLDVSVNNNTINTLKNENPTTKNDNINSDFKDMIEKQDIASKVENFISDTLELLATNTLAYGREDKEKYELIDKKELNNLKNLNNELKDKEESLIEEYNSIANKYNQLNNEFAAIKKKLESKKASVSDKPNLSKENKELVIQNEKLTKEIEIMNIKRDNIIRSLLFLKNYYNKDLPPEFNKIVEKYNKDQFKLSYHSNRVSELEYLQNKLSKLKESIQQNN